MPIPNFNKYGLLPPGLYPVTLPELEKSLGFSAKRRSLIDDGLKPVIQELLEMGASELFIDGSFVMEKPSPNDIDGYVLAESTSDLCNKVIERQELWKSQYRLDLWPAITDMEGECSRDYFNDLFGHTKDQPPKAKGLLKLKLRG